MSDASGLLWALKSTYAGQCVRSAHGLTFAGDGFAVHVHPSGRIILRLAEGTPSPAQGWLLTALAEFLAPAGGVRSAEGVSVPVGEHVVHFCTDGRVRLQRSEERAAGAAGHHAHGAPDHHISEAQPLPHPAFEERRGKRAIILQPQAYGRKHRHEHSPLDRAAPEPERAREQRSDSEASPGEAEMAEVAEGAEAEAAAEAAGPPEDLHATIEAMWERWAHRARDGGDAGGPKARDDRRTIRGLLEALRQEGSVHSRIRKALVLRLVALDELLRKEGASESSG